MPTAAELKDLYYDRGEFDNCLVAIQNELVRHAQDDPERSELLALAGWCRYRKREYETARQLWQEAGQVRFAREGLAYLAAYIDKDDLALGELIRELGDSVNAQNAFTIRARDQESTISHEQVMEGVLRFTGDTTVEMANLYHNAGRVFFHKARGREDLIIALGLYDVARARYGIDRNWHHRGALHYWRSRVFEVLLDKRAALEAARDSLYCWTQQVILDPATESHKRNWENAVNRVRELVAAL
ncbi:MAG TPA: hypothetical protein VFE94_01245 [Candidatus Paceibacterota bacterium]|nr:hypothetical protein [Candidatus Paceibacterota bacterium]